MFETVLLSYSTNANCANAFSLGEHAWEGFWGGWRV